MIVRFDRDITLTAGVVYRIQSDSAGVVELCELTRDGGAVREWTVVAETPELGLPGPRESFTVRPPSVPPIPQAGEE